MARRRTTPAEDLVDAGAVEILFEAVPGQQKPAARIDGKRFTPPQGARQWFTVRTVGGDFDVVLGTDKILRCLKDAEGHTSGEDGIIAISEEATLSRIAVVLVHEIFHALLSSPAEYAPLAKILGCRSKSVPSREEDLVAYLAPKVADCLIRSGLLRLPPIPRRRRKR